MCAMWFKKRPHVSTDKLNMPQILRHRRPFGEKFYHSVNSASDNGVA